MPSSQRRTHVCPLGDDSNPLASSRAVDLETEPLELFFEPATMLNVQCLAIPRTITGRNESQSAMHELISHQLKTRGPTSHVDSKYMLILMLMLMSSSISMI